MWKVVILIITISIISCGSVGPDDDPFIILPKSYYDELEKKINTLEKKINYLEGKCNENNKLISW